MLERNSVSITLHDVDPTALRQLIEYTYSGEITITEDNVQVFLDGIMFGHVPNINLTDKFDLILCLKIIFSLRFCYRHLAYYKSNQSERLVASFS